MEWEYDVHYIDVDAWTELEPAELLNKQGYFGWELVAVQPVSYYGQWQKWTLILKRS